MGLALSMIEARITSPSVDQAVANGEIELEDWLAALDAEREIGAKLTTIQNLDRNPGWFNPLSPRWIILNLLRHTPMTETQILDEIGETRLNRDSIIQLADHGYITGEKSFALTKTGRCELNYFDKLIGAKQPTTKKPRATSRTRKQTIQADVPAPAPAPMPEIQPEITPIPVFPTSKPTAYLN